VEARQRVQLTSTNSSIGLIYALKKIFSLSKHQNNI
jgi:hypothetical protein